MKKWITVLLSAALLLSLSACVREPAADPTVETPDQVVEITLEAQPETVPEAAPESRPLVKEPPVLGVLDSSGQRIEAFRGTYSWCYDRGDGMELCIEADSLHPLQAREYLIPMTTADGRVELSFEIPPQEISVRCWSDAQWDNFDAEAETAALDGSILELKEGGYIYEVTAVWTGENMAAEGSAHYAFYVAGVPHKHTAAQESQTVEDPVSGYCGNTVTVIRINGEEYSFMGTDSVTLTDILINLSYDPELVCKCVPDFSVDTEFGTGYGISLSGYARCGEGQAELTEEQLQQIRQILENQTK